MKYLFILLISTMLVGITCCGPSTVNSTGGYTQADLDYQYRLGYERGNKQGYSRGYDMGIGGMAYSYAAPRYRAGNGFNVYLSPRNGGQGYSNDYGTYNDGRVQHGRRSNNSSKVNRSDNSVSNDRINGKTERQIKKDAQKQVKDRVTKESATVDKKTGRTVYEAKGAKEIKFGNTAAKPGIKAVKVVKPVAKPIIKPKPKAKPRKKVKRKRKSSKKR